MDHIEVFLDYIWKKKKIVLRLSYSEDISTTFWAHALDRRSSVL
ncbi:protein of unknown function [Candidatus Nitrosotalea okcheonensis]|uniref:Uncharacterized protein n=1 Tax=Candidatus Nitrosotalea okcheonensis TaxID=1903276 RepID=A0A2H1FFV7_9ARCH|nr:protein of unknown function [Candidatus Nitrosotalea okcheonensis]